MPLYNTYYFIHRMFGLGGPIDGLAVSPVACIKSDSEALLCMER
jgi:hypothetical protein